MYVCVCVIVCVHVAVCVWESLFVFLWVSPYVWVCVCVCEWVCMCMYLYECGGREPIAILFHKQPNFWSVSDFRQLGQILVVFLRFEPELLNIYYPHRPLFLVEKYFPLFRKKNTLTKLRWTSLPLPGSILLFPLPLVIIVIIIFRPWNIKSIKFCPPFSAGKASKIPSLCRKFFPPKFFPIRYSRNIRRLDQVGNINSCVL